MQALKGLVVGLTILIIVAMTVIAYGLYRKADDPDFKFFSLGGDKAPEEATQPAIVPSPAAQPGALPKAFGEVMLSLPEGCVIASVTGDGTRMFLKIGPAGDTCERVIIVDATSGALLGTLKVAP
ncbi:MAG: hypothetical protein H8E36_08575 [Rhodospirillaceae bacterium]|nr:hypothetical protein [Rhodospirillaceae bacterium]MBL6941217.1 hypothetical protein [Rhodospirillales bacterium]